MRASNSTTTSSNETRDQTVYTSKDDVRHRDWGWLGLLGLFGLLGLLRRRDHLRYASTVPPSERGMSSVHVYETPDPATRR